MALLNPAMALVEMFSAAKDAPKVVEVAKDAEEAGVEVARKKGAQARLIGAHAMPSAAQRTIARTTCPLPRSAVGRQCGYQSLNWLGALSL